MAERRGTGLRGDPRARQRLHVIRHHRRRDTVVLQGGVRRGPAPAPGGHPHARAAPASRRRRAGGGFSGRAPRPRARLPLGGRWRPQRSLRRRQAGRRRTRGRRSTDFVRSRSPRCSRPTTRCSTRTLRSPTPAWSPSTCTTAAWCRLRGSAAAPGRPRPLPAAVHARAGSPVRSRRLMPPRGLARGSRIDQRATVFTLARLARHLLCGPGGDEQTFRAGPARLRESERGTRRDPQERHHDVRSFVAAWRAAAESPNNATLPCTKSAGQRGKTRYDPRGVLVRRSALDCGTRHLVNTFTRSQSRPPTRVGKAGRTGKERKGWTSTRRSWRWPSSRQDSRSSP